MESAQIHYLVTELEAITSEKDGKQGIMVPAHNPVNAHRKYIVIMLGGQAADYPANSLIKVTLADSDSEAERIASNLTEQSKGKNAPVFLPAKSVEVLATYEKEPTPRPIKKTLSLTDEIRNERRD